MIEDPLSEKILWKEFRAGETIIVDVERRRDRLPGHRGPRASAGRVGRQRFRGLDHTFHLGHAPFEDQPLAAGPRRVGGVSPGDRVQGRHDGVDRRAQGRERRRHRDRGARPRRGQGGGGRGRQARGPGPARRSAEGGVDRATVEPRRRRLRAARAVEAVPLHRRGGRDPPRGERHHRPVAAT